VAPEDQAAGGDGRREGIDLRERRQPRQELLPHRHQAAYHEFGADAIVAERNNGGAMVETTIHAVDSSVPVRLVWASRGKQTRAEPIAAFYEQRRIFHLEGQDFAAIESQLCTWVPGLKSPDRLDALVWLFTDLMLGGQPISFGPHPFPEWD
jgi:phage terminase large subunit-like protein